MKKQFILAITLLLMGYTMGYSQCLFEDNNSPNNTTAKATFEAKNGVDITTLGTLRVLAVYIEVNYDIHPNLDRFPLGTSVWAKNELPTYKDNLFDANWTGNPQGIMTNYFAECSFNQFKVLGDYINQIITVNESDLGSVNFTTIKQNALQQINQLGILNTHYGSTITDLDNWKNKAVRGDVNISGPDSPYSFDHIIFIYRNYHAWSDQSGMANSFSPETLLGYHFDTYTEFNAGGSIPFNIFRHEFGHLLFGGNNFHASGSHSGGAGGGTTFIPDQKGWSMMGGRESSFQTCNAWDRDRMDWKAPGKTMTISAINTNGLEMSGDLDAMNSNHAGIYLLRDFVTTGDALRIKLPFIPSTEYQEYIWIENHQTSTNNGSNFDHYTYESLSCMTPSVPGIYMYVQAGKDIKTGDASYYFSPIGQNGHYLRFLPADGMYDLKYESTQMQSTCIGWNWFNPFEKQPQFMNPLTGTMDLERPANDNNGDEEIHRAEHKELIIEKIGNQYYNNLPYLGHSRHAFTLNGNSTISMSTNPSTNSMMTLERGNIFPVTSGKDNRIIRLNGVAITILEELPDGSIKVEVKFDQTNVNNNVRWCGNIELNAINGANGYSLNLTQNKTINIDQGYTPTRIDNPMAINGEKYFVDHTLFTCLDNAYFHIEQNANVNVINGSTLHLKADSKLELEDGAKLYIGANSQLIIDDGAILNLKPGAVIEIDEDARVEYHNNQVNKGLLVGSTGFTGNPAKVVVKGNLFFSNSAKWDHLRDGYYHFYPSCALNALPNASIKFVGKGKARTMMVLEDNTILSFNGNDIDWYNGQIEYGNHSKIEMDGVDFKSLACTYNPNNNPTNNSKGLVINNPNYLFLKGCDFNQFNEGLNINNINNVTAQLTNCKFTNNTTLGIKVQNSTNLTITGGQIDAQNGTAGLYAQYVNQLNINTTEIKSASTGVELSAVAGAYFNGANIHSNTTGIKAGTSLVFLRNGAKVHNNTLYGVNISGVYNYYSENYTSMLTVGDVGCGGIFNNPNVGVFAIDVLLNIDAVQHSIDRGDNQINPNRFDNNGLMTFEVCYGSSAVAPSEIGAKGNFWGVNPPDITSSQYGIVANVCVAQGATPVHIPLIHTNYSTCEPTSSCTNCYNTSGGTTTAPGNNGTAAGMAVQTSFSDANIQFIAEDNVVTRNEFSDLSAVELVKNTTNDTWQVQSINNQTFSLSKPSVHLVQVSKAIKAVAINSSARMIVIPDDVFKNVEEEKRGSSLISKISLYPNPTHNQLMIDIEKQQEAYQFKLFNVSGKLILETTLNQSRNVVDVNSIPEGLYYYEIVAPNKKQRSGKISVVR